MSTFTPQPCTCHRKHVYSPTPPQRCPDTLCGSWWLPQAAAGSSLLLLGAPLPAGVSTHSTCWMLQKHWGEHQDAVANNE
jgi:hypothetical protein